MRALLLLQLAAPATAPLDGCCHAGRVSASCFGKSDTEALQGALSCAVADTVVVEARGGRPWVVSAPIQLPSHKYVVFEPGTVVRAQRWRFHGTWDSLFQAGRPTPTPTSSPDHGPVRDVVRNLTIEGNGARWQMWRDHYANAACNDTARCDAEDPSRCCYRPAEWRHTLMLWEAHGVRIRNLTMLESGGDCVMIGYDIPGFRPSTGITLSDLTCERHYRQGISIDSATDVLVERSVFRETFGTAPMGGVDIEPDGNLARDANITFRGCRAEDNFGYGFKVSPGRFTEMPAADLGRINFVNCTASWSPGFNFSRAAPGDGNSAGFMHGGRPVGFYVGGLVG